MPLDPLVTSAVLAWLRSVNPSYLARAAVENRDVLPDILRMYPPSVRRVAYAFLGEDRRKALSAATDRDFSEIVDKALREVPAVGQVLWANEAWFLDQMRRVRDAFVQGV